jgi:hypothetical protein
MQESGDETETVISCHLLHRMKIVSHTRHKKATDRHKMAAVCCVLADQRCWLAALLLLTCLPCHASSQQAAGEGMGAVSCVQTRP